MAIKMRIAGNTVPEEFQAQMLSGKPKDQAAVITFKKKATSPRPKFKLEVRGRRFNKKRKGISL